MDRESLGKGRSEFVYVELGVVFVRGQGTARRNDGPPTCFCLFLFFIFSFFFRITHFYFFSKKFFLGRSNDQTG